MRASARPPVASTPSAATHRADILTLIEECDATLQQKPTCLHTRAIRGHACMKAKMWSRAIEDFSIILHVRADDIHGRFSRGMAMFKSGRIEDAHSDFTRVLELSPHHVMARYARAGCYNSEGKFHRAIQDYTIALEHDELGSEKNGLRGEKHPRGWHQKAEKLIHEKLSGCGTIRSRSCGSNSTNIETQKSRMTAFDATRDANPVEIERNPPTRETLNTGHVQSNQNPRRQPRKVVQVRLSVSDLAVVPGIQSISESKSTLTSAEAPSVGVQTLTKAIEVSRPLKIVVDRPNQCQNTASPSPVKDNMASNFITSRMEVPKRPTPRVIRKVTVAL